MSRLEAMFGRMYASGLPGWVSNPTMLAIRNGFLFSLPLVVTGSLALLLNNLPIPMYQTEMARLFGPNWQNFGLLIWQGTFGILSLPMLYGISQYLATLYNQRNLLTPINPIIAALVAFASLVVMMPTINGDWLPTLWTGSSGLFVSIVVALTATKLFLRLASLPALRVSLYAAGGDFAIPQAFACLIPGILTVFIFGFLHFVVYWLTGATLYELVHSMVLYPFSLFQDSIGTGFAYVFVCQLVWFFGIHGPNVLDPMTHQFYQAAMDANLAALAAGTTPPHTITKLFLDIFVYMGGSGSSICLIVALLLASRNNGNRRLAHLSVVPALFNINEILLFGLPVILNPIFLVPFVLVPIVLTLVSYIAVHIGWVPTPTNPVDWTSPPLIGGYASTGSIRGSLLQLFNIALGCLLYLPFVRIADRIKEERQKKAMHGLLEAAMSNTVRPSGKKCLDRDDEIGDLARALANDLQKALNENEGLFLEYQPQVDSNTNLVIGAEALVRWRHPAYGLIPAPIMVAISEDGDFIKPLGMWVLNEACAERKHWQRAGIDDHFELSVNLSTLQLDDRDLARKVSAALARHQLMPMMIGLEVTESAALDPNSDSNKILQQIHALGIGISIDDFGMGHSSLVYLKHFPVSTLKIDKVLSKDVANNKISAEIITTIVDLCRALGVDIVVEFVEDQEQIDTLRKLGCHIFQGYFYSRPLEGEKMLAYALEMNAKAAA